MKEYGCEMPMIFSGRHRYAMVLACVAVAILVSGFLLKPEPKPSGKKVEEMTVTRAELENLQQLVRRNSLRNLATSFAQVADNTNGNLTIAPDGGSAVLLPDMKLVAAKKIDALPPDDPSFLWMPGLPFYIAKLNPSQEMKPARVAGRMPVSGSWVTVVSAISGQTSVSPGIYDGIAKQSCGPFISRRVLTTVPLTSFHQGGGLFDLAGDLLGVVVACDDGPAVVSVNDIRQALVIATSDAGVVLANYGLQLGVDQGAPAIVDVVWDDWPADVAGLQPGDEIVAVDGKSLSTTQDVRSILVQEGASHKIRVSRAKRVWQVELRPMPAGGDVRRRGVEVAEEPEVTIRNVATGSSAEAAGLRSGDRIVRLGGRSPTRARVEKTVGVFRVSEPITVIVRRPGRRVRVQVNP